MIVLGLDLSLTSTGVALVDPLLAIDVARVTSKPVKDATLDDRCTRLACIQADVEARVAGLDVDLVVVEGPSFGQQRQGGQHDRAGLWWQTVTWFLNNDVPVVEVPPATVKLYATGKGNAGKDQVLAAVVRRYPDVDVTGNDEADALILAAMGARHLGHPIDDLPKAHLKAMDKVRWSS